MLTALPVRAADLGTAFTYQGFLEKPAGTPLNDTCTFEFKLCSEAAAACVPGTVSLRPGIAVTNGVFTVPDVDFGAGSFPGDARWVESRVQCTGDSGLISLSPRVKLTPAPYALRAAEGVGPPDALNVAPGGNVGIGTTNPVQKLHVNGNARIENTLFAHTIGGLSPLTISSSQSTPADDIIFEAPSAFEVVRFKEGGQVGIGTSNPAAKLHVFDSDNQLCGARMRLEYLSTVPPNGCPGSSIWDIVSSGSNTLRFSTPTLSTPVLSMRNSSGTGVVGIGTTSPTKKLHVHDGAIFVSATNDSIPGLGGPTILFGGGTPSDSNGRWGIEYDPNAEGLNFWKPFPNPSGFGNYFLFLANNGRVGVGTSTPTAPLTVNGVIESTVGGIRFPDNTLQTTAAVTGVSLWGSSGGNIYNLNNGFVGIGTSNPFHKLDVTGNIHASGTIVSGGFLVLDGTTFPNTIDTTSAAGLRLGPFNGIFINNIGDVGIGTTTPAEKLEVNGNIEVNGDVFANCGVLSCSDSRFKRHIEPLNGALDVLANVRPVRFDWRREEYPEIKFDDEPQIGFVAQELREVVPEVVRQGGDGYYSVDYGRLAPLLVEAVRELREEKDCEIDELLERESVKDRRITELETRLVAIEAFLACSSNAADGGAR